MHGVKRQKYDADLRKRKLQKDASKIVQYRSLTQSVFEKRENNDYSSAAFNLTGSILDLNPEFYTIWNYRREILTNGILKDKTPKEASLIYEDELNYTMAQMKKVPKCYWVWNHRVWCLNNNPLVNWNRELAIVSKILDMDARNFHGWSYRRFIISSIEEQTSQSQSPSEFQYTTKLINKNFSNYSALHNRSQLIIKMFADPSTKKQSPELAELFSSKLHFLKKELDYFKNAIYTDPDDQSVWLYLNWLLTSDFFLSEISDQEAVTLLTAQAEEINELNEAEKEDNNGVDNKWCLKIKSQIQLVLYKKYTKDEKIKTSVLESIELLKKADPKRLNMYLDIATDLDKLLE